MKIGARPTDEQIIAALKRAGGGSFAATYVIRNWLTSKDFGNFRNLTTSQVLYRLKKMEIAGLVRRTQQSYYSGKYAYWEIVE